MAAFEGKAVKSAIVLVGATKATMIQLVAAANHRVRILGVEWSFNGISATEEPILVEIERQTSAGTMSALTPVKIDDSLGETLQTTAQHTSTVAPTPGDVVYQRYIHPQTGWSVPWEDLEHLVMGGGDRIGFPVTSAGTQSCTCTIRFEE